MKALLSNIIFSIVIVATSVNAALASDRVPDDAIPITTAVKNLQSQGYVSIKEIRFDDGVYKAKALNAEGYPTRVSINAKTGQITVSERSAHKHDNMGIMLKVIQKVEAAGYTHISKVERSYPHYEVKAIDQKGKRVKLKVNPATGDISKDRF